MLTWLLFLGCDTSDPCADMCQAAVDTHSACLAQWEAQWTDFGYADEQDFRNSCDTWAWEMRLLEKDARSVGDLDESGVVDGVCLEREKFLLSDTFNCDAWSSLDWNETPWKR